MNEDLLRVVIDAAKLSASHADCLTLLLGMTCTAALARASRSPERVPELLIETFMMAMSLANRLEDFHAAQMKEPLDAVTPTAPSTDTPQ